MGAIRQNSCLLTVATVALAWGLAARSPLPAAAARSAIRYEPQQIAQWFSEDGSEDMVGAQARIFRAKAFKYTAHGKSTYVFFSMSRPKHPDPCHPEGAPEHTQINVSQ